ncbi:hypothetical protein OPT61_g8882 [Boeremia exigua]|uniref:Uncharacterized protein n=1 Tax=Boeremia exigua TaxID=749465 RepID=A0ACC2HX18_9PLEO|nr:hypothetical protein OPT61_g8882 [Boeremia exigua]
MDISTFSTEALQQELRNRQDRLDALAEQRRSALPAPTEIEEDGDDSLFVPERSSRTASVDTLQSREQSTHLRGGPWQEAIGRKRRRSPSSDFMDEFTIARTSRDKAQGNEGLCRTTINVNAISAGRGMLADQREEEDRQLAERLQAQEDHLAVLMEEQLTNEYLGTKSHPVDLSRSFLTPKTSAARRLADQGRVSKPISRPSSYSRESLDAAMARQLEQEEQQALEERLHQAAARTHNCAVCSEATPIVDLPSLLSCVHKAEPTAGTK